MLRSCSQSIAGPLATLFNRSLSTGVVPSEWKKFNVTPIFKSGDRSDVTTNYYHPISLLPLSSKLLELVVHNALMGHVLSHQLLSDSQFGFRPGSFTLEVLLAVGSTHWRVWVSWL